jgi:hypothetical protein
MRSLFVLKQLLYVVEGAFDYCIQSQVNLTLCCGQFQNIKVLQFEISKLLLVNVMLIL